MNERKERRELPYTYLCLLIPPFLSPLSLSPCISLPFPGHAESEWWELAEEPEKWGRIIVVACHCICSNTSASKYLNWCIHELLKEKGPDSSMMIVTDREETPQMWGESYSSPGAVESFADMWTHAFYSVKRAINQSLETLLLKWPNSERSNKVSSALCVWIVQWACREEPVNFQWQWLYACQDRCLNESLIPLSKKVI